MRAYKTGLFLFVLLCLNVGSAFATSVLLPTMEIEGKVYSIDTFPLEFLWISDAGPKRPQMRMIDTSRGDYTCRWRLMDNKLRLVGFYAKKPHGGGLLSATDAVGAELPLDATWFTGVILAIEGEAASGVYGTRDADKLLAFEDGSLVKSVDKPGLKFHMEGRIGVTLEAEDGGFRIKEIVRGGSADESQGLALSDFITAIESDEWGYRSLEGLSLNKATSLIRGPRGTSITIHVKSNHGDSRVIILERKELNRP